MINLTWGLWVGGGLIVLSVILFIVGWIAKTLRIILFIVGVVILLLSLISLYFGKIPFL